MKVRKGVRIAGFYLFVGIALVSVALSLSPVFVELTSGGMLYATQDEQFVLLVQGFDQDSNYPLNFTYNADAELRSFSFRTHNSTWGLINFTPSNAEVGVHSVILILYDSAEEVTAILYYVNVSNVNDPPNITGYAPEELEFSMQENSSLNFSFDYNASDIDIIWGDRLNATYFLDGEPVSTNITYAFSAGFCEPETRTVGLVVQDLEGLTDSLQWNISEIVNVNRPPTFNVSRPLPNLTWPEDTNIINLTDLWPFTFFDEDANCSNRADAMDFSSEGNHNITISISQAEPRYVSFIPDRDFSGINTVRLVLSDGHTSVASNLFILNVTSVPDAPYFEQIPNRTIWANVPFYYVVNVTDPEGDLVAFTDDTELFDITSFSGEISFTPLNSQTGIHTITINATDETGLWNSSTFVLTILPNSVPWLEPISDMTVNQNETILIQVKGHDLDGNSLTINMSDSAFNKTWHNATAANFTFIPYINGSINITAYVWDERGAFNSTMFSINISYFNFPPSISSIPPQIAKINKIYRYNVTADDGDGGRDILTFFDNASFFSINSSTGEIVFTALEADRGNHTVNISVWDNGRPPKNAWTKVEFEITHNRPPEITSNPGAQQAWEHSPYYLRISAIDPDNDPVIFSTNSTLFQIDPVRGEINFTPNASQSNRTYMIKVWATDDDGANDSIEFSLHIFDVNDPPFFDPPVRELIDWTSISEKVNYLIYVNVTDDEHDEISFGVEFINCTINCTIPFGITVLDASQGRALINMTLDDRHVGEYTFNITATDIVGNVAWENITMVVSNVNDPPEIIAITPYGRPFSIHISYNWRNVSDFTGNWAGVTRIDVSEGDTVRFNQTSRDVDGDKVYYLWTVNGVNSSNSSQYTHFFDYDSKRRTLVNLKAYDIFGLSTNFTWNFSVADVNRVPIFGMVGDFYESDFEGGDFNSTEVNTTGWICLQRSNYSYLPSGTYLSKVHDLKARQLLNISFINFSRRVQGSTSVEFFFRTSPNNFTWGGWSEAYDPRINHLDIEDERYVQYMVKLSTLNTLRRPCFSDVTIQYKISNFTINNNNVYSSVLNLQDYFYDLDPYDQLTFTELEAEHMDVTIESSYNVRIEPHADYYGFDYLRFQATDGNDTVRSNLVHVNILEGAGSGGSSSQSSSSTRIVIQTQIQKEKEQEYSTFNMIAPSSVTVYENESVEIPLRLENTANETLFGIKLKADSVLEGVNYSFSRDEIAELAKGAAMNVTFRMTPFRIAGTYEVVLTGLVNSPKVNDTVKVMINSRQKGSHNASMVNTKIAFTHDLLGGRPECFELNELLAEAVAAFQGEQYAKASSILDKVVDDCRHLIYQTEPYAESPMHTGNFISALFENDTAAVSAAMAFIIVMLGGMYLLYKKT
jgi:hypothetical protein